jgi:integrase/recombinase XerC
VLDNRDPAPAAQPSSAPEPDPFPDWFTAFLQDRQTRKPSAHTMKAYRQDFVAIASLVTNGDPAHMDVADITKESMRSSFATYAQDHEAASIRRCWSTWNVLCTFLYTGERLATNPMQLVGRPKLAKALPKALPRTAVEALLETVAQDRDSKRRTDWAKRDLAIILTALLAGLRAAELRAVNVGDIRTTDDGAAVIHVKGKGGKERSVPIEAELLSVIRTYLDSRALSFPDAETRRATSGSGLSRWPARAPLFVGRDGQRITPGTLQSRIKRAFKRGPRRPTRTRTAPHLRHRTRRRRRQRLHPDEAARPRIDDHLTALRHRRRIRNSQCGSTESSLRAHTSTRRPLANTQGLTPASHNPG